jgi:hypothetical protein
VAGTCGYSEGLSGSINVGNFLTSCKVYWLASQEGLSAPWSKLVVTIGPCGQAWFGSWVCLLPTATSSKLSCGKVWNLVTDI